MYKYPANFIVLKNFCVDYINFLNSYMMDYQGLGLNDYNSPNVVVKAHPCAQSLVTDWYRPINDLVILINLHSFLMGERIFCEYSEFHEDPVIGSIQEKHNSGACLKALLAHEFSHFHAGNVYGRTIEDRRIWQLNTVPHGYVWKSIYYILRKNLVNRDSVPYTGPRLQWVENGILNRETQSIERYIDPKTYLESDRNIDFINKNWH